MSDGEEKRTTRKVFRENRGASRWVGFAIGGLRSGKKGRVEEESGDHEKGVLAGGAKLGVRLRCGETGAGGFFTGFQERKTVRAEFWGLSEPGMLRSSKPSEAGGEGGTRKESQSL